MKRFKSILCASLLTLSLSSVALAGNISGGKAGNISGGSPVSISGTISTTIFGIILGSLIP